MNEPVILIPGLLCDARVFEHQILHLSRHRPVTIAQPQGHTVEEMSAALVPQLPPRAVVVGQGLGGDVALDVLRRAGDRISRIALISTDPLAEPANIAAAREARMVAARAGRLFQAVAEEYPLDEAGPRTGAMTALLREMADHLGEGVYLAQSRAMQRRPDQQKTLRRATVPALILGGARDTLVPPRRHELVAGLMPFAKLRMIEGAGHLLTLEAPEVVTAALEEFLRGPMLLR
ncbi:MAG: hypothetical protein BGP11_03475 [Rhodobacterales bacterium 65-51]|uniref:Alpha/beta hydrolase n=1 Tax=Gemmobacter nanjingensis TaxID=488454 RepID=A0ABQ3FMN1_9RHOB|nr:alpha/beta hydrolase [Gemmobacter nanjingensis]OJY34150.1 MAG: hypothetical protein BGP11_03475 [Rhodobacterales bacterium 65-51]GHC30651.1 alpha/beta hydrolase [Gemmobacter nanjingensis]